MSLRRASLDECSIVRSAVAEFRAHWSLSRPLWPCEFAGTVADLEALDYLNYEGLGYPNPGFAEVALVWGNVLATTGPFRWFVEDSMGALMLCPELDYEPTQPVVWPYGRVYEKEQLGNFGFGWLTVQVVAESLAINGLDSENEARLLALIRENGSTYRLRFERALGRIGE